MKNSFVLYTDYLPQIELLTNDQRGQLFTAIMYYAAGKSVPPLDSLTAMAFSFIRSQLDKDTEKYEKTVAVRREAGKLGGRPRAEEKAKGSFDKAKKAKGYFAFQEKANESKEKQKNPDNENDSDNVLKENSLAGVKEKAQSAPPTTEEEMGRRRQRGSESVGFVPPTVEEVVDYCLTHGYQVDAQRFIDFYASKGWMVGKNKMKDWKAAIRNWARGDKTAPKKDIPNKFHDYPQRDTDYDAIAKLLNGY